MILVMNQSCDSCQRAKSRQLPYAKSCNVSTAPLELIHSDVWGPAPVSVGRHTYYVSFIDDYSRYTWIYLLKKKSDVFQVFKNFQSLVERKFDKKILSMQTDWGGECEGLNSFFQRIGIAQGILSSCTSTKWVGKKKASTHSWCWLSSTCKCFNALEILGWSILDGNIYDQSLAEQSYWLSYTNGAPSQGEARLLLSPCIWLCMLAEFKTLQPQETLLSFQKMCVPRI